jgi:hypothetical protein
MSDVSRRGFFKLVAGAAALVALPRAAVAKRFETIWCDGVHDDAPGLTALLRGEAVEFADPSLAENILWVTDDALLLDDHFTLHTPVKIGPEFSGKMLVGGRYEFTGLRAFEISGVANILLKDASVLASADNPWPGFAIEVAGVG